MQTESPIPAAPATLILLPGLHGTAALFTPLLHQIPPNFPTKIITYPTDCALTAAAHYRLIEDTLQTTDNLILVAESYSGPLALRFANAHRARVCAVILCVSFIAPPVPRILCYLAAIPIFLRVPLLDIAIRTFLAGFRADRQTVRDLRREVRSIRPHVLAHRVRQMAWVNARADLRDCPVPILCLAARKDRLIGRRSAHRIARTRPDISIHWLDGPHLLLQTRPAEVWNHISHFLKSLYTSPSVSPCLRGE
jgi:pimeloyl-ACP methyl ester carboxylesterase